MELIIDTRNGIAGDISVAGLISLGANQEKIIKAMENISKHLGKVNIKAINKNGIFSLNIDLGTEHDHLHETEAKEFLSTSLKELDVGKSYTNIAQKILEVLCDAERYVHKHDKRLHHMIHHHGHEEEVVLHEAKDIIIDIIGFVVGLQELDIQEIYYLDYVNVGNGIVKFSHGSFDVPSPATLRILSENNIKWCNSEVYKNEMTTPTGVSILAGSEAKRIDDIKKTKIIKMGSAIGTRKGLPSINFYLVE